ncbi:hypothetical protein G6L37_05840 [Agrobacterium rubi]|nr:hypothetical protein [Agrobacterium rubi]NTF24881.1 hypothetical protein [Agrobacterium rubi]
MIRMLLSAAVIVLAIQSPAFAGAIEDTLPERVAPTTVEDTASEHETLSRIEKIRVAIDDTLRIKAGQCTHPCEPTPTCDAQGRRPNGDDCTLVWKTEEGRPEFLTWVEKWEARVVKPYVPSSNLRLPTVGQDGKLY